MPNYLITDPTGAKWNVSGDGTQADALAHFQSTWKAPTAPAQGTPPADPATNAAPAPGAASTPAPGFLRSTWNNLKNTYQSDVLGTPQQQAALKTGPTLGRLAMEPVALAGQIMDTGEDISNKAGAAVAGPVAQGLARAGHPDAGIAAGTALGGLTSIGTDPNMWETDVPQLAAKMATKPLQTARGAIEGAKAIGQAAKSAIGYVSRKSPQSVKDLLDLVQALPGRDQLAKHFKDLTDLSLPEHMPYQGGDPAVDAAVQDVGHKPAGFPGNVSTQQQGGMQAVAQAREDMINQHLAGEPGMPSGLKRGGPEVPPPTNAPQIGLITPQAVQVPGSTAATSYYIDGDGDVIREDSDDSGGNVETRLRPATAAEIASADPHTGRIHLEAATAATADEFLASDTALALSATDPVYAAAIAGLEGAKPADKVFIYARADGTVYASNLELEVRAGINDGLPASECEALHSIAQNPGSFKESEFDERVAAMKKKYPHLLEKVDEEAAKAKRGGEDKAKHMSEIQASAFDKIEELEIGGGMTARRKGGKKEAAGEDGKEKAAEIEVVDKEGKVIETFPDAFGDDTVPIIKFLRQVMKVKDGDEGGKGKDDGGKPKPKPKPKAEDKPAESVADKPVVLPDVGKDEDLKAAKIAAAQILEDKNMQIRAARVEARLTECREIVEALMAKGQVVCAQADIDAELLKGSTLRDAQRVAARRTVDMEIMGLLGQSEAEIRHLKASLATMPTRQMKVHASLLGGMEQLVTLSAGGLIVNDNPGAGGSNIGLALSAAFGGR